MPASVPGGGDTTLKIGKPKHDVFLYVLFSRFCYYYCAHYIDINVFGRHLYIINTVILMFLLTKCQKRVTKHLTPFHISNFFVNC